MSSIPTPKSIDFNPRVAAMQPSATLAMTARARARKRAGHPVISLSAGEPDFDTPEPVRAAAAKAIADGFTHYTDNQGTLDLREAICAKLLSSNGLGYSPDQVVVSNGAKQSVAMAVNVLCRAGDEVLIPAPYWVSYPEMVRFAGAEPVAIPTTVESGYRLTPDALEAAISERSRVLILCSPSNPTGAVYTPEAMAGLMDVLERHPQVFLISDEIYEHIRYGVPHVSPASRESLGERTVTVNGFSKAYAMTGWRLGYLAAAPAVSKSVAKVQSQLTSAPSSISQAAGLAALRMDHGIVSAMRDEFRRRRDLALDILGSIDGLRCPRPDGAFYLFPAIDSWFGTSSPSGREITSSEGMCFYLLEEHDIALVPGHAFGDPRGIRLSYATSPADLEEALSRFRIALERLN